MLMTSKRLINKCGIGVEKCRWSMLKEFIGNRISSYSLPIFNLCAAACISLEVIGVLRGLGKPSNADSGSSSPVWRVVFLKEGFGDVCLLCVVVDNLICIIDNRNWG